jgi:phosphate transport system permease protein
VTDLRRRLAARDRSRKLVNALMVGLLGAMAFVAIAPLLSVFVYVMRQGLPALNWDFFTKMPAPVGEEGGGFANALAGSGILIGLASVVGIPWGVLTGVYLSEFGQGRLGAFTRFVIDILASVPSIIVGLFAYALFVMPMKGFSALAGGAALAVLMIPTVARTTEELLKLVPVHVREAGLALGIPRWKVTLLIVLRGSLGGILTGVMLAIARVAGETAPLLFTALSNRFWSTSLTEPIASLPVQIYNYAISPFEDWHRQAWAAAFVLVVFVLGLNLITRLLLGRTGAGRGE